MSTTDGELVVGSNCAGAQSLPPPLPPLVLVDTRLGFVRRFYVTMGAGGAILLIFSACKELS